MARSPRADLAPIAIIPAFNAAATIASAVASALAECRDAIVVDDGSTDATAKVAEAAGATVIQQSNAGPATARNRALDALSGGGSPILFLDADDELLAGAAGAITDAFTTHPAAAAVIGGHIATPMTGRTTTRLPDPEWLRAGTLPAPELALGPYHVFCTSGLVLSPAAASALRFDPALHFAEDRDLIYRAAKLGPIAVIDRPLITKYTGRGLTDDPRRVHRWLNDQLALVAKHCTPVSLANIHDPTFEPLRACTDWVVKHALRTGASGGAPVDAATWARLRAAYADRCWPLSASVRRTYWLARLKASIKRATNP